VDGLLRDLGSRLQRGSQALARAERASRRLATGLPQVDRLIQGGFPPGRLAEIVGPVCSGRTSLALALLARATRGGEVGGWVDAAQALDAASAQAAGAVLERVLWARPSGVREAVRCCECLLDARGFALVVLDLADGSGEAQRLPASTWQRLSRRAAGLGTALVVLSPARTTGSFSDLVLELQPTRAHFSGTPALLDGISIEARVARQRTGPVQRIASVRLSADRSDGSDGADPRAA
jgi:hypothetical protein